MVVATPTRGPKIGTPEKPMAAAARSGQELCHEFIRSADDGGVLYEKRCVAAKHHDTGERHRPGPWTEVPTDITEIF